MSSAFVQDQSVSTTMPGLPSRAVELKSPTAFRTISEVATDLDVPQHVLRFWESKFQQIRPMKRGGGRRYYRPEDIQLISGIKDMLYNQGFTIRGVQKILREKSRGNSAARTMVAAPQVPSTLFPVASASADGQIVVEVARADLSDQVKEVAASPEIYREIESVLGELKSLRELLRQSGI